MARKDFTLSSPAFAGGETIPVKHTCDGDDISPGLDWTEPPEGTRSYALVVDDPDAPDGTFTHWILYDLPAQLSSLPEGATGSGIDGRNDFEEEGYGGPCPPLGDGEHRYFFRLHALDVGTIGLGESAGRKDFDAAVEGHVLGTAELVGRFGRE